MAQGVEEAGNNRAAADTLLAKIRTFVADQLTDKEATLFAGRRARGGPRLPGRRSDGFRLRRRLASRPPPDSLAEAVRDRGIRIEGLAEE